MSEKNIGMVEESRLRLLETIPRMSLRQLVDEAWPCKSINLDREGLNMIIESEYSEDMTRLAKGALETLIYLDSQEAKIEEHNIENRKVFKNHYKYR